jgi:hypothetical protein
MLVVGETLASTLDENSPKDFIVTGQAGSTVTFSVEPDEDESDLVIEIFDANLNSLIRQDDGISGESEVVAFAPPADGIYFIRVNDFFGAAGSFEISVTEGGIRETIDPEASRLEPNQLLETAVTGESAQYLFAGTAGQPSIIFLIPEEDWDPTLTILGTDGTVLVNEVDEGFPGQSETITFTPTTDGDYIVLVDAFSLAEGGFSLFLIDPALAFTADGVVSTDESQDYRVCVPMNASLVVVVSPADDFDTVININGPDGVQLIDEVDGGSSGDSEAVIVTEGVDPDADYPVIVSVGGWAGQDGDFSVVITSTSAESVVLDGC